MVRTENQPFREEIPLCDALGASIGRYWGRLGDVLGVLGHLGGVSGAIPRKTSIFASNFDPRNLKIQAPAAGRARFSKNQFWKRTSIFYLILVPTWLHFASQNPPKSFQKSIPRCIKFLIDFCIDFFSIVAPTWYPSWGHVGRFFA